MCSLWSDRRGQKKEGDEGRGESGGKSKGIHENIDENIVTRADTNQKKKKSA
jgi:hypothetical protein